MLCQVVPVIEEDVHTSPTARRVEGISQYKECTSHCPPISLETPPVDAPPVDEPTAGVIGGGAVVVAVWILLVSDGVVDNSGGCGCGGNADVGGAGASGNRMSNSP